MFNVLFVEMDGFDFNLGVIVMGVINWFEIFD